MAYAPSQIRSRSFSLVRRGYDPDEVGAFLGEVAEQVHRLTLAARRDRYRVAAREVEAVLRTAHDEAERMRREAEEAATRTKSEAREVVERARLEAAEIRAEAERERDEAKRLLLRSQERGASLVREAEERGAGVVRTAEALARSRATNLLTQAQRRLERITRDEHQTQRRLLDAQEALKAVIEQVGTAPEVIDLTPGGDVDRRSGEQMGPGGKNDPLDQGALATGGTGPEREAAMAMVRAAVDAATRGSAAADRAPGELGASTRGRDDRP